MPAVLPPATVAVTGASGFVGSHVTKELLRRGYTVRAIVTNVASEAKTAHLKALPGNERLSFHQGGLLTPGSYDAALTGCDAIVHCAAKVHEGRQGAALLPSHLEGTQNVLASVQRCATIRRFVQTSSEAAIIDVFRASDEVPPPTFSEADSADSCTPAVGMSILYIHR